LIYSFILFKYRCKTKTTSAEKALNHSDHFSGTGPLRLRQPINHPGRKQNLQHPDHNCTAATPPSKGGETFSISLATNQLLRLTAMGQGGKFMWIIEGKKKWGELILTALYF
jgi:hypothetical protein